MPDASDSNPYSEVYIANYSAVMTCYELLHHPVVDHSNKKMLIIQPFWLDNVHDSRLDSLWGQNVMEFPTHIRDLLIELNPDIVDQERVTFRQVKELRAECIKRIKSSDEFDVIERGVENIAVVGEGDNKRIAIKTVGGDAIHDLPISRGTKLFNFSQVFRKDGGHPQLPPQADVYRHPKGHQLGKSFIFGGGLSAVWFMEQTRGDIEDLQVCVRSRRSRLAPAISRNDSESIRIDDCIIMEESILESVVDVRKSKDSIPYLFDEEIQKEINEKLIFIQEHGFDIDTDDDSIMLISDRVTKEPKAVAKAYIAYGYVTDKSLYNLTDVPDKVLTEETPDIEQRKKSTDFYAPKNIPGDAGFARYLYLKKRVLGERFTAEDVDIEALVIIESEKQLLAEALKVPLEFIDHLCLKIRELEDTPVDPEAFIRENFNQWVGENSERAGIEPDIHTLFQRRSARGLKKGVVVDESTGLDSETKEAEPIESLIGEGDTKVGTLGTAESEVSPHDVTPFAHKWKVWHEKREELEGCGDTNVNMSVLNTVASDQDILEAQKAAFLEMKGAINKLKTKEEPVPQVKLTLF